MRKSTQPEIALPQHLKVLQEWVKDPGRENDGPLR